MDFSFKLEKTHGYARAGSVTVRGKSFDTPAFMPVGTRGSVKGLDTVEIENLGYRIILMNAYHLHQRPGEKVVASLGGLGAFSGYPGVILTDSGGYQLFSFGRGAKLDENGAKVYSPYDGSSEFLTPEDVVKIQLNLSSDILMPLDVCLPSNAGVDDMNLAVVRTDDWLRRSVAVWHRDETHTAGALFGIIQGGTSEELRLKSLELSIKHDLPGYAIGGLSVGESRDDFGRIVNYIAPQMPSDKPRYLMGVGTPEDLMFAVDSGIDMFDCVLPTRNARNGMAFTSVGRVNLMNAGHIGSGAKLDPNCICQACNKYPLGYISHLVRQKEITGIKLLTLHNLTYYKKVMDGARRAIVEDTWAAYRDHILTGISTSVNDEGCRDGE